jgi:hypothetical protein
MRRHWIFPKVTKTAPTAKSIPRLARNLAVRDGYASSIAGILRVELGNSHQAVKTLMRWTGANERTAKNWLSGTNGPSGEHLLAIMRNSELVFESVLALIDRRAILSHRKLEDVREALETTARLLTEMIQSKDVPRSH